jgi:hypothetical protein
MQTRTSLEGHCPTELFSSVNVSASQEGVSPILKRISKFLPDYKASRPVRQIV